MTWRLRLAALIALGGALVATTASLAAGATTGHSQTIAVRCTGSGFITDANAFAGQRAEVTAFYNATGIVCRIYDGETDVLLYDPSA
jgi:hypothetical protein